MVGVGLTYAETAHSLEDLFDGQLRVEPHVDGHVQHVRRDRQELREAKGLGREVPGQAARHGRGRGRGRARRRIGAGIGLILLPKQAHGRAHGACRWCVGSGRTGPGGTRSLDRAKSALASFLNLI